MKSVYDAKRPDDIQVIHDFISKKLGDDTPWSLFISAGNVTKLTGHFDLPHLAQVMAATKRSLMDAGEAELLKQAEKEALSSAEGGVAE